jgi:hypothetical protein
MNAIVNNLTPNAAHASEHLYALFPPAFVQAYPDGWIEIAYAKPDGKPNAAENFSAFDLEKAAAFAVAKNKAGYNIYVGAALRHGAKPDSGRADGSHVLDASHAWAEYDGADDDERIQDILKASTLAPTAIVTTGTVPHIRRHLYFRLDSAVTPAKLEAANTALCKLLDSDSVQNPDRVMRLAGTVNYPSPKKAAKGYVTELTSLANDKKAIAYRVEELIKLVPGAAPDDPYLNHGENYGGPGRSDEELIALLKASRGEKWHDPMRDAVATMVGRGWPDSAIKMACTPYCDGSFGDDDLQKLIDTGRKRFNKPNVEAQPSNGDADESDVARLSGHAC